jgi:L-ascorbate metabolism protein UlaG (beta-lactamase superfamily)
VLTSFGKRASGQRLERMRASPRWDDSGFKNLFPVAPGLKVGGITPTLKDFLCGGGRRVPRCPLPSQDPRALWQQPPETGLRVTWLGHSTVLLEIDGARLLTDPVWGERASPTRLAGPKRFQPVPISIEQLPPLDAVVISHDHYDHLDLPTIQELARLPVPFVTSLGVGAHLEAWGVPPERIIELDWWESYHPRGREVSITAAPSQHFSGRTLGTRNSTLWSSFAIKGPDHALFFSGDTGLTAEYRDLMAKLGPFDLAMLEVGAFHPAWGDIHLGPEHALEALAYLGKPRFLPVHWGTFNLALHPWDEPAEVLLHLAPTHDVDLVMPRLGAPVEPARCEGVDPWWRSVAVLDQVPVEQGQSAPEEAPPAEVGFPID